MSDVEETQVVQTDTGEVNRVLQWILPIRRFVPTKNLPHERESIVVCL